MKRNGRKMQKEIKPKRIFRFEKAKLIYLLPVTLLLSILLIGASAKAIPDGVYFDNDVLSSETVVGVSSGLCEGEDVTYTAKLFGFLPAKNIEGALPADLKLVPCGDVFGVKFFTKGVIITDISEVESDEGIISPAAKAGLKKGDVINSINGKEINSAEDLGDIISSFSGKSLNINFTRDGKSYKAHLSPVKSSGDGMYKAGLWVRDSTAGIGTVTFYNPDDGSFAGLGHGIYDSETELLMPLLRGAVVDLHMEDILKGKSGHPGELKGSFGTEKRGTLLKNTPCGVFGVLSTPPETVSEPLSCALKSEVKKGEAYILCNVDGKGVKSYSIKIEKIYSGTEETKNFVISVNDDKLLAATGGIVRGMSGSPIIQNGKLIGAVTHVLVNDPTKGYGIFIENMISEAGKTK